MATDAATCLLKSTVARFLDLASAFLIKTLASLLLMIGILFIAIAMIQMIYIANVSKFYTNKQIASCSFKAVKEKDVAYFDTFCSTISQISHPLAYSKCGLNKSASNSLTFNT
jgi:hypothetical protein